MLKNENKVRYLVLVIEDGAPRAWFCTSREKIPDFIDSLLLKKTAVKIIRYYPNQIAFDNVRKKGYSPEKERLNISRGT